MPRVCQCLAHRNCKNTPILERPPPSVSATLEIGEKSGHSGFLRTESETRNYEKEKAMLTTFKYFMKALMILFIMNGCSGPEIPLGEGDTDTTSGEEPTSETSGTFLLTSTLGNLPEGFTGNGTVTAFDEEGIASQYACQVENRDNDSGKTVFSCGPYKIEAIPHRFILEVFDATTQQLFCQAKSDFVSIAAGTITPVDLGLCVGVEIEGEDGVGDAYVVLYSEYEPIYLRTPPLNTVVKELTREFSVSTPLQEGIETYHFILDRLSIPGIGEEVEIETLGSCETTEPTCTFSDIPSKSVFNITGFVSALGVDGPSMTVMLDTNDWREDPVDGDVTDGDVVDGDVTDGDVIDGDVTDGDVVDGDVVDGDVTDGDVTDGDEELPTGGSTINFIGAIDKPFENTYATRYFAQETDRGVHLGQDLRAAVGTQVRAGCTGPVSFSSDTVSGYGSTSGADGSVTLQNCTDIDIAATMNYGHCTSTGIAEVGDVIQRGDVICEVAEFYGPDGVTSWAHLHEACRIGHYGVDPGNYLIGYANGAEQPISNGGSWVDPATLDPENLDPCVGLDDGTYCGDNGLYNYAGDAEDLVECKEGVIVDLTACTHGCVRNEQGYNDTCNQGSSETCDGVDNDFDGLVDEDYGIGTACQGKGECGTGTMECDGPYASRCSTDIGGSEYAGSNDVCNNLDDDCDGNTDEDYSIGSSCLGKGECGWGVFECNGIYANRCSTDAGGSEYDGSTEVCDGLDNDCDGSVDEGYSIGSSCNGVGACGYGEYECNGLYGTRCSTDAGGSEYDGSTELCNNLDDDCDGSTDEGYSIGSSCNGVGACGYGEYECNGLYNKRCSTDIGGSDYDGTTEVCDGLDNDCDGSVDEGSSLCGTDQICQAGSCVDSYYITADYEDDYSPSGVCDTAVSRALYRMQVIYIDGNFVTLRVKKCTDTAQSSGRIYWIVTGEHIYPQESLINAYVPRVSGTWSSTITKTIYNVPVWPDVASLREAACGETKRLFVITDGSDTVGERIWYQYRSVQFTKVCR